MKRQIFGPVILAAMVGCGGGGLSAPVGEPVPDPSGFASSIQNATIPSSPEQISFGWELVEQGSRVRGRGVVRVEAPERIRLDLFGPRDETYLIAALVGDDYRLPPEASNAVALPSPSLLWAALGVLEPPSGATLTSATREGTAVQIRYSVPGGDVFVYTFTENDPGQPGLTKLERTSNRGVLETVTLERSADNAVRRASYRDWTAFRDLTLDVESIRTASSFPQDIWRPDVASR